MIYLQGSCSCIEGCAGGLHAASALQGVRHAINLESCLLEGPRHSVRPVPPRSHALFVLATCSSYK